MRAAAAAGVPLRAIRSTLHWYLKALRQYCDFSGRARRREYWLYSLVNLVASLTFGYIDDVFGWRIGISFGLIVPDDGPLNVGYLSATFLPTLAVGARRLHDIGRNGWWQLLIPLSGLMADTVVAALYEGMPIVFKWPLIAVAALTLAVPLVLQFLDSKPEPNKWGPSPKIAPAVIVHAR